ncbi:MAG: hypothetical protein WAL36_23930, partial [Pseudolabrys sp.]
MRADWQGVMNNRRKFIVGLGIGALAAPFRSLAKQQDEVWRRRVVYRLGRDRATPGRRIPEG